MHIGRNRLADLGSLVVQPMTSAVSAALTVPGSKSQSNREILISLMAEGTSRLSGLLDSDDTKWALDVCRRLGAAVADESGACRITGIGRRRPSPEGKLYVGSAGTLARFLPGLLAAGDFGNWDVSASEQMSRRPMGILLRALRDGGARIDDEGRDCFPFKVRGGTFAGGRIGLSGSTSSQFVSGLLLAGPLGREPLQAVVEGGIVQSDYVRMTIDRMVARGAEVVADRELTAIRVTPSSYKAADVSIEADASTATYFSALPAIVGGTVTLTNLPGQSRQPDLGFLKILERMGCRIDRDRMTAIAGPAGGKLRGGFAIDMQAMSDSSLTLAAVAVFADGPIKFTGVEHIRHHECDRLAVMSEMLRRVGIAVDEARDGLTVYPGSPKFADIDPHDDHRVAMSMALVGLGGAGVRIGEPNCVSKTCPNFFDLLESLGCSIQP